MPTIVCALAVSVDGLAIAASEQVAKDEADSLAAITSGLASLTIGAAKLLSTGRIRQTVVDMDGGVLLVMSAADRAFLAVLAAARRRPGPGRLRDRGAHPAGRHRARTRPRT